MTRKVFNFSMRRFWALSKKETCQMMRDPSTLAIAFLLPIILLFVFGFGVNLDATRVRLGIVSEDQSLQAQNFFKVIQGTHFVEATFSTQFETLVPDLQQGKINAILIIPINFSKNFANNIPTELQLITDGSVPNTASFTQYYLKGLWEIWYKAQPDSLANLVQPPITLIPRYWFNPTAVSRNSLLPGSIAIVMTIIGAMLTSLVVAREWERGTMEGLLTTSMTKGEFLLSKIVPYFVLGLAAMVLNVFLSIFIMGLPFHGSYLLLIGITGIFLLSALGLGLLISTVTRNQFNAAQTALSTAFLPAVMLSGFIYEISSMPDILQKITTFIPARYFVSSLHTLFQAGVIPSLLLKNSLMLVLLAFFWLGITVLVTKNRLD